MKFYWLLNHLVSEVSKERKKERNTCEGILAVRTVVVRFRCLVVGVVVVRFRAIDWFSGGTLRQAVMVVDFLFGKVTGSIASHAGDHPRLGSTLLHLFGLQLQETSIKTADKRTRGHTTFLPDLVLRPCRGGEGEGGSFPPRRARLGGMATKED